MSVASAIENVPQSDISVGSNSRSDEPSDCRLEPGLVDRWSRQLVLQRLSRIVAGRIIIDDGCDRFVVGTTQDDDSVVRMQVRSHCFYRRLIAGGSLGFAESYMDGEWDTDNLPKLIRIFARNRNVLQKANRGVAAAAKTVSRLGHWLSRNTRTGSRRNIEAHYDLGNEFFRLFLDPTMMYSAAIFDQPDQSLEDAQTARLDHICRRLDMQPGDEVVEIGTGWGGFAIHAAKHFGCRVTTTTISQRQYEWAKRRVAEEGLEDRIELLFDDYRDLSGRYDKLVSIEMVEAVGHQFYDQYFAKCASLLKPDGRMLLQAIVMPEQRYKAYVKSVDFIQKYIFPGGSLPSVTAMQDAVARASNLRMIEVADFADGYAQTLREWRRRFRDRIDEVRAQGYSEKFIRMWDYYFCYCEAAFDERAVGVVHAVWGR